jgi:hypothetical protein
MTTDMEFLTVVEAASTVGGLPVPPMQWGVLTRRQTRLIEEGLIEHRADRFCITPAGRKRLREGES